MTAQEVFDLATKHLLSQNYMCTSSSGVRPTYAYDGRYSAIGVYLKHQDPELLSQIEGIAPEDIDSMAPEGMALRHQDLLLALEEVHDRFNPEYWADQFHVVAMEFGLTFQGIDYQEATPEPPMIEHTFSLTFKVRTYIEDVKDIHRADMMAGVSRAMADNVSHICSNPVRKQPFAVTVSVGKGNANQKATITLLAFDEQDAKEEAACRVVYGEIFSVFPITWQAYNELHGMATQIARQAS